MLSTLTDLVKTLGLPTALVIYLIITKDKRDKEDRYRLYTQVENLTKSQEAIMSIQKQQNAVQLEVMRVLDRILDRLGMEKTHE